MSGMSESEECYRGKSNNEDRRKPGRWHCYSRWMVRRAWLEEVTFELRLKEVREGAMGNFRGRVL